MSTRLSAITYHYARVCCTYYCRRTEVRRQFRMHILCTWRGTWHSFF